jgi:cysteinyl-tRNA synthetase, unknown class
MRARWIGAVRGLTLPVVWAMFLALAGLLTCTPPDRAHAATRPVVPSPLASAKSWGYQLRGIEPSVIARSSYDVVVIDFADRERPFTSAQVAAMRVKPDGSRRFVLAYLSIGEAERYRYYWQPAWQDAPPAWLGPENPEWRGNYPVRFWNADWQKIVFGTPESYLDRILSAGFDGAYLDRVDVHSVWEKEKADADRSMIEFVGALSAYAKRVRSEFLIVPQNAEELLEDVAYLQAIDGVAKEDLLYGLDHSEGSNDAANITYSTNQLKRARRAGKGVFVVEYLCQREEIAKAARRIGQDLGFLAYVGPRTLHRLGMEEEDYCLPPGSMGRRIALLIGSSAYQYVPPIAPPATNVKEMAAALRQAGFTQVRERMDLGRDSISQEFQRFAEAARTADWAVVYITGLGMHLSGTNYLLPVNARIDRPADVAREAIALEEAEIAVEPAKGVRLIFVDACRPNPFLEQMQRRGMTQAAGPGMTARPTRRPVAIAYGNRCETGVMEQERTGAAAGDSDIYTRALARHLATPGLELPWLMERVRDSVLRATKGKQDPAHLGTLPDKAMFTAPVAIQPPR